MVKYKKLVKACKHLDGIEPDELSEILYNYFEEQSKQMFKSKILCKMVTLGCPFDKMSGILDGMVVNIVENDYNFKELMISFDSSVFSNSDPEGISELLDLIYQYGKTIVSELGFHGEE